MNLVELKKQQAPLYYDELKVGDFVYMANIVNMPDFKKDIPYEITYIDERCDNETIMISCNGECTTDGFGICLYNSEEKRNAYVCGCSLLNQNNHMIKRRP